LHVDILDRQTLSQKIINRIYKRFTDRRFVSPEQVANSGLPQEHQARKLDRRIIGIYLLRPAIMVRKIDCLGRLEVLVASVCVTTLPLRINANHNVSRELEHSTDRLRPKDRIRITNDRRDITKWRCEQRMQYRSS
jgi:hypothetical protein